MNCGYLTTPYQLQDYVRSVEYNVRLIIHDELRQYLRGNDSGPFHGIVTI
jgi:hypothetical protein